MFITLVVCLECGAKSNKFDMFLDVSLEVKNAPTLEAALQTFVLPEALDICNAYKCDKYVLYSPANLFLYFILSTSFYNSIYL